MGVMCHKRSLASDMDFKLKIPGGQTNREREKKPPKTPIISPVAPLDTYARANISICKRCEHVKAHRTCRKESPLMEFGAIAKNEERGEDE